MEYGKIIAVTGLPGLFELLNSKNDGAIVRSLDDKTTKFVSSRVHNFSHLESIEVFTVRDNINLIEIFHAMDKEGGKVPDGKDAAALKKYFEKVYGELDFERVYTSDLKKMAKWYEILKNNKVEIKLTEQPVEEEVEEPVVEEKPASKKKAAPVKEETAAEKPAKTATAEKKPASAKATAGEEKPAAKTKAEETKPAAKKKAEPKEATASATEASAKEAKKAPAKKSASAKAPADKTAPKKK